MTSCMQHAFGVESETFATGRCSASDFRAVSPWSAEHAAGFTVRIERTGGVFYADGEGEVYLEAEGRVFLETEHLVRGLRMHLGSRRNRGVAGIGRRRGDKILHRVVRALRFLGLACDLRGRLRTGPAGNEWRRWCRTLVDIRDRIVFGDE